MLFSANVFNDLDCSAEAGRGAAGLGEAREAQICAVTVFENDEKLDNENHRLQVEA
jgi:hypothetical protein